MNDLYEEYPFSHTYANTFSLALKATVEVFHSIFLFPGELFQAAFFKIDHVSMQLLDFIINDQENLFFFIIKHIRS
jgi:hypothetical protein